MKIGILAIQGDFYLHGMMCSKLKVDVLEVRKPQHLVSCDALIIPGGESTTFIKLLKEIGLYNEILSFSESKYIFGTCAGLITLANSIINSNMESLKLLDVEVERNAYGRQSDSFIDSIDISINNSITTYEGVFIRAPKILKIGEGVRPVGHHKGEIVLVESKKILAATFHPELTEDPRIHHYFLQKCKSNLNI